MGGKDGCMQARAEAGGRYYIWHFAFIHFGQGNFTFISEGKVREF